MTSIMIPHERSLLPNVLSVMHHDKLNLRYENQTEMKVDSKTFKEWSQHLALFLNQSAREIEANLRQLFEVYQTQNIENCLKIINKFPVFPGYPFMTRVNFVDHINYVCHYLELATKKDNPKVPLFAFRKTASSFINVVFCRLFDLLPTVLSFDHFLGMDAWVKAFSKWGGVLHEHYYPSQTNLGLLYQAGIKKCVIHNRHPIDIVISFAFHMIKKDSGLDQAKLLNESLQIGLVRDYLDREMEPLLRFYGLWLRTWRREASSSRMEIMETHYEDMKSNPLSFFKRILAFYNLSYQEELLKKILHELNVDKSSYNFRKAKDNEWQTILTPEQIHKAKKIIQEEFQGICMD